MANLPSLAAFSDEMQKIALSTTTLGGLTGAGLALGSSAMKEWDTRHLENQIIKRTDPKDQESVRGSVKANRNYRFKRMGVKALLAGGVGAGLGHVGGAAFDKAVSSVSGKAKDLTDHTGKVLDQSIDRLGNHWKEPFEGEKAVQLGENLKKGLTPDFLKKPGIIARIKGAIKRHPKVKRSA